jgi:hypothetical protein
MTESYRKNRVKNWNDLERITDLMYIETDMNQPNTRVWV